MQKDRSNTFETRVLLTALLAMLLLVAPCKVRNSIETSLGLAKSDVSNKIKATTSSKSCCAHYDSNWVAEVHTGKSLHVLTPYLPTTATYAAWDGEKINNAQPLSVEDTSSPNTIPLYILYQNFKGYL